MVIEPVNNVYMCERGVRPKPLNDVFDSRLLTQKREHKRESGPAPMVGGRTAATPENAGGPFHKPEPNMNGEQT